MNAFDLGRILYEARIREAWNYGRGAPHPEARLAKHPYPSHPADADPFCQSAEVELAQAQAKAVLKVCGVSDLIGEGEAQRSPSLLETQSPNAPRSGR